jgi:hypothetical protein
MELKKDVLEAFKGGQAEIQNSNEGYLYRGQIESITLEGGEVAIGFTWLAKGEGFPPLPKRWVKDDQLDYRASLLIYSVSNIGPSGDEVGGGDRLCLTSPIVGETVILYPADGSKLDPSKVEGLELVSA